MQMYDRDSKHQQWVLHGNNIVNARNSDDVLDIIASNDDDGAELHAYALHGGENQCFCVQ